MLDIGCNAGFYSIEMKKRGADRVLAIDSDEEYLAQARFAAEVNEMDIEFRKMNVYEVPQLGEKFDRRDLHGRPVSPASSVAGAWICCTIMSRRICWSSSRCSAAARTVCPVEDNYPFWETEIFDDEDFPKMHFIEHRYAGDSTNWWIPNRACVEAMLRSSGFEILDHPEEEVYICKRRRRAARRRLRLVEAVNDLERAEQQIALGLRDRSGLEDVFSRW